MAQRSATVRTRRPRRTQDEVRALLLDKARERFAQHGYHGVSARVIAADADASPMLVFSYFGSKAGLFEQAVLEPFRTFFADFLRDRMAAPRSPSLIEETRIYVAGMYELFRTHRKLVIALLAMDTFDGDALANRAHQTFAHLLGPVEDYVEAEAAARGWTRFHTPTIVRALLGMIISMAVMNNVLYTSPNNEPPEDLLIDQLTRLVAQGYLYGFQ